MNTARIHEQLERLLHKGPERVAGNWEGRFVLEPDFVAFDGHFPGSPILPAFVQVMMAQMLLKKALARPLHILEIGAAKFTAEARPMDELVVRCKERGETGEAPQAFDCRIVTCKGSQEQQVASFRLLLEPGKENA